MISSGKASLQYRSRTVHGLNFGHRVFAPGWLTTVLAILLIALFVRLGLWQLHRADETRALAVAMAAQQRLPPLDLNRIAATLEDPRALLWRPAAVRGSWDAQRQVLLDNQIADGRTGYAVFTPLRVDHCRCLLLVDRGWIAAPPQRSSVPDIGIAERAVEIGGILAPVPFSGMGLRSDVEPLSAAILRVQQLDLARIPTEPGWRLLPFVLRLDPAATDGYRRRWPQPGLRADRHQAYAVQWFLFALIVAGLYAGLNLKRRKPSE